MKPGTCPLCKAEAIELQDSHILPKGVYKGMRKRAETVTGKTGGNPNPVHFLPGAVVQSSMQRKCHLLCRSCEQLLSRNGEHWTLSQILQSDGSFPLRERVLEQPPVVGDPPDGMMVYSTKRLEVDHDALSHFAVGIVWKMQHYCKRGGEGNVRLGTKYEEVFRRYLLGEVGFPDDALLLIVFTSGSLLDTALPPYTFKVGMDYQHRFVVPGLAITLMVGRGVPSESSTMCFARDEEHPIMTSKRANESILALFQQILETTPPGKRIPKGITY